MICCLIECCLIDAGSLSLIASALAQSPTEEIQFKKGWVLSGGQSPQRGRSSLPIDPIEHAWISSSLSMPDPNAQESPSAPGLQPWKPFEADEQSGFAGRNLFGAVLALHAPMQQPGIWMLDAQGHASVRINGSPRTGDVYANGSVELPIALKAGDNWLVLQSGRGRIAAKLKPPPKPVFLSTRDTTFPTFLRDEPNTWIGSVLLVNAQETPLENISLRASAPGCESINTPVVSIPPLSVKKVPFALRSNQADYEEWKQDSLKVVITAIEVNPSAEGGAANVDEITVSWPVRNSTQTHRRTFLSAIDNSVQYYGVVPPAPPSITENSAATATNTQPSKPPALILSLHGAGVEGEGQANVYAQKPNTYIIAPTNRRNFGFDWEDWGRWDALEVLEQAQRRFQTDPTRTYITGHSMGGHGTWHIGTLFPDRFAALGPSAGWISFATYAGRGANVPQDPISVLLRRPLSTSDTLARVSNLKTQGVYILHGDADDNVPVDQARSMREELAKFHPDWVYKEQPGAGHWWGNACCDWPPMIDFFFSHQLPDSPLVPSIDFTTPGPHVSPSCHWFLLGTQDRCAEISHVQLQRSIAPWKITGTTENVASFAILLDKLLPADSVLPDSITLEIDGSTLELNQLSDWLKTNPSKSLWLQKSFSSEEKWEWKQSQPPAAQNKNPNRYGVLKEAFRNRFLLIYGTEGTPDENRWMLDKARFDAETFWYRGNGSVDCLSDAQWLALQKSNPQFLAERNCIVYGNATANAAWRELLASSPISIENGRWKFGDKPARAESVMAWFLRPHPTSDSAMVAAIGGTDLDGMKSGTRLPLFSSGTAYPDAMIVSPNFLKDGIDAVRNVGFFGPDWSVEKGEWKP
jgi:dienelactone hydrolase